MIFSIITAITAIVAIFLTGYQIYISNKQYLFDKKIKVYVICKGLFELYEQNKSLLETNHTENSSIYVDFNFVLLTNNSYLKDITDIIKDTQNYDMKIKFLLKIEEIKNIALEIKLLFKGESGKMISKFIYNFSDLLLQMYKYQIIVEKMHDFNKEKSHKKTFEELQSIWGELNHRKELYEKYNQIKNSYNNITSNKIISKIEKRLDCKYN